MREYKVTVLGVEYVYRGATRAEIERILRMESEVEQEDEICRLCVLQPKDVDWDNILAGVPTALAEKILEASGMTEESSKKFWEEAQEWILSSSGKTESLMMGVFHLPLSVISNMDPEEWYRTAAASQLLAVTMFGMDIQKYINMTPGDGKATPSRRPTFSNPADPNAPVIPPPLTLPENRPRGQ